MSEALVLVAVLACPVGMGLMMFLMGRGMLKGGRRPAEVSGKAGSEQELAPLRAEQARLEERIATVEAKGRAAPQALADAHGPPSSG